MAIGMFVHQKLAAARFRLRVIRASDETVRIGHGLVLSSPPRGHRASFRPRQPRRRACFYRLVRGLDRAGARTAIFTARPREGGTAREWSCSSRRLRVTG